MNAHSDGNFWQIPLLLLASVLTWGSLSEGHTCVYGVCIFLKTVFHYCCSGWSRPVPPFLFGHPGIIPLHRCNSVCCTADVMAPCWHVTMLQTNLINARYLIFLGLLFFYFVQTIKFLCGNHVIKFLEYDILMNILI